MQLVVADGGTADVRRQLETLTPDTLLTVPVTSHDDAEALLAGLWLWHDFLDESHTISQGLHSATGSFWHAVMHRREGDFGNAKYWYARCRSHPALVEVQARLSAAGAAGGGPGGRGRQPVAAGAVWRPEEFVDAVERVHRDVDSPAHAQAVAAQRAEWAALFDHCIRAASGGR